MNFFRKLFSGTTTPKPPIIPPSPVPGQPAPAASTAREPKMIRVYDDYGRAVLISQEQWRQSVLPGTIQAHWDRPDDLYNIIVSALNDGFVSDVVAASERLFRLEPGQVRGACVWSIVLMKEGRLDEAEKVLRDFTVQHGEDGSILTNLAKVYAARHESAKAAETVWLALAENVKARETLWRALEVDPNLDNGLAWYEVMHREEGGEEAGQQALRRVAALPKSWRAQLWMARHALQHHDLAGALALYEQSLAAAPVPAPPDLLVQLSGDLGNAGHLPELIRLTLPRFNAACHGVQVGNNLIKALFDIGQIEPARRTLQALYAVNRPDWKQTLSFWETELAKLNMEIASYGPPAKEVELAMLRMDGPLWLPELAGPESRLPGIGPEAVRIGFLGSSVEVLETRSEGRLELSDPAGRLSRALPLFLGEQMAFGCGAVVRLFVPWLLGDQGAFFLRSMRWEDEEAASYARSGEKPCAYVVLSHLNTRSEPWAADLRLIHAQNGKLLAEVHGAFDPAQPERPWRTLADQLLAELVQQAGVRKTAIPAMYCVPTGALFLSYLGRLENLLLMRCAERDDASRKALKGPRDIVDASLDLCLEDAKNVPARLLLCQICCALKQVQPEVLATCRDKIELLQRKHPLEGSAQSICQRLFDEAFKA